MTYYMHIKEISEYYRFGDNNLAHLSGIIFNQHLSS